MILMIIFKIKIIKILMIIKVFFVSVKNNKNKDENVKDFHSFCKDKRINFKDNFSNIIVSVFVSEYKL